MRIIAGEARGRRLLPPPDKRARPTSDRVRESIFNTLHSRASIDGHAYLDLFAGTGALGLEALSRGARSVTLVESNAAMAEVLEENVARVGLPGATVVRADAFRFLDGAGPFSVALLDPPYGFDDWEGLLARVDAQLVVAESDRPVAGGGGWTVLRQKKYGTTVVSLLERSATAAVEVAGDQTEAERRK